MFAKLFEMLTFNYKVNFLIVTLLNLAVLIVIILFDPTGKISKVLLAIECVLNLIQLANAWRILRSLIKD